MSQFIITRAVLDIESGKWEVIEGYEYAGPIARCDRSATAGAKKERDTDQSIAGTAGANAASARRAAAPLYKEEMNAQHDFNPGQLNELLRAAGSPLAASAATTAGKAASQDARTRYTSGYSSALDQA